jgi:membrane protein DedA with SNARE-associated domain
MRELSLRKEQGIVAEVLEQVRVWIEAIILGLGYLGIALVMLVENLFPPIPSELVMPFAGFLAGRGELSLAGILIAGTVGSVAGAVALYYVGYWAGEPLVRPFVRRYGRWFLLTEADLDRAMGAFTRYGDAIVFSGRLVPLIRSLISLPAGMQRMPFGRFLLFTTLGSTLWNLALTLAGLTLGVYWERVLDLISDYQKFVLAGLSIALIVFIVSRLRSMRPFPLFRQPSQDIEN